MCMYIYICVCMSSDGYYQRIDLDFLIEPNQTKPTPLYMIMYITIHTHIPIPTTTVLKQTLYPSRSL